MTRKCPKGVKCLDGDCPLDHYVPTPRNPHDPLAPHELIALRQRHGRDYLDGSDLAGRYAQAWLDIARLLATLDAREPILLRPSEVGET